MERRLLRFLELDERLVAALDHDDVGIVPKDGFDGHDERRAVDALLAIEHEGDVLRRELDDPVDERDSAVPLEDVDRPLARDELEEIIALDRPALEVEPLGVAGVEPMERDFHDLIHELHGAEGNARELRGVALVGAKGERRLSELGVDQVQLVVGALDVLTEVGALGVGSRQEGLRTVQDRTVDFELSRSVTAKEQKGEKRRKPVPLQIRVVVEPELRGVDRIASIEVLPVARRSEEDVVPAPVRLPTFPEGVPTEELVDVGEPLVVLVLVLVLERGRVLVPLSPEGLDERFPLLLRFQAEKDVALDLTDEVRNLFQKPLLVMLGELVDAILGKRQKRAREDKSEHLH